MMNERDWGNPLPPDDGSIVHDTLAPDESTTEDGVMKVTGACRPGALGQRLKAATQTGSTTRVIVPNKHVARAVHEFAKAPMKDLTDSGAVPYRTAASLLTPAGDRLVRETSTPPATVELLATGGVNLTVGTETLRLPGGEAAIDADTDLPDGVFIAKDEDGTAEMKLTRGGGTTVATLDSEADLRASYAPIQGWFRPDRLSYRCDITIHYPDPADSDTLCTHDCPPQESTMATPATLTAFFEQFSVSAEGHQLEKADLRSRYRAWLDAANQTRLCSTEFGEALHSAPKIETTRREESTVIPDRAWRFSVTYER
ncbi:hypothetical protein [Haloplanus rubicundus]|uniref:Uncharacterized protein n=1 Tax=Haloplanus rubicundus TaxID=1547898 RepID=A0A345EBW4_9EURY|nr:hypothetical protein [Haloplanus rubicundus]AXG09686.1 hypothetical protein DU484_07315 [Haloplanus rubicundus]